MPKKKNLAFAGSEIGTSLRVFEQLPFITSPLTGVLSNHVVALNYQTEAMPSIMLTPSSAAIRHREHPHQQSWTWFPHTSTFTTTPN